MGKTMKSGRRSRLDRDLDEVLERAAKSARRFRNRASDMASDATDKARKTSRHARRKTADCKTCMPKALGCASRFAKRNPVLIAAGVAVAGYALVCAIRNRDDRG